MKTIVGACLGIALFVSSAASSPYWDGNKLKMFLDAYDRVDAGSNQDGDAYQRIELIGYIGGVTDSLGGSEFCIPAGTTLRQLLDIVGKYVREHPEEWGKPGSTLIADALEPVFRCAK